MAANSTIEWCDASWNPVRGCSRVSDGCERCYAEGIARRFSGPGKPYEGLIHSTGRWNGQIHLAADHLLDPIRWGKGRRIFVNSMSDLFHEAIPFEYIDKVFAVMACTTRHTYQVLTKRPERMVEYFNRLRWNSDLYAPDDGDTFEDQLRLYGGRDFTGMPDQIQPSDVYDEWKPNRGHGGYDNCGPIWPLVNVWLGVSCENQATADERIPLLLKVPAAVRFLSCEPLLGSISLFDTSEGVLRGPAVIVSGGVTASTPDYPPEGYDDSYSGIDWVIAGGESGPGARSMVLGWAKDLVRECQAIKVPVFMKQLGARPTNREGQPHEITDRKGAVMAEWPEILRVREFPA